MSPKWQRFAWKEEIKDFIMKKKLKKFQDNNLNIEQHNKNDAKEKTISVNNIWKRGQSFTNDDNFDMINNSKVKKLFRRMKEERERDNAITMETKREYSITQWLKAIIPELRDTVPSLQALSLNAILHHIFNHVDMNGDVKLIENVQLRHDSNNNYDNSDVIMNDENDYLQYWNSNDGIPSTTTPPTIDRTEIESYIDSNVRLEMIEIIESGLMEVLSSSNLIFLLSGLRWSDMHPEETYLYALPQTEKIVVSGRNGTQWHELKHFCCSLVEEHVSEVGYKQHDEDEDVARENEDGEEFEIVDDREEWEIWNDQSYCQGCPQLREMILIDFNLYVSDAYHESSLHVENELSLLISRLRLKVLRLAHCNIQVTTLCNIIDACNTITCYEFNCLTSINDNHEIVKDKIGNNGDGMQQVGSGRSAWDVFDYDVIVRKVCQASVTKHTQENVNVNVLTETGMTETTVFTNNDAIPSVTASSTTSGNVNTAIGSQEEERGIYKSKEVSFLLKIITDEASVTCGISGISPTVRDFTAMDTLLEGWKKMCSHSGVILVINNIHQHL